MYCHGKVPGILLLNFYKADVESVNCFVIIWVKKMDDIVDFIDYA